MFHQTGPLWNQVRSPRFLCRLMTLFSFCLTSTGVPLDFLHAAQSGCRCGDELQQSGQCCCAQVGRSRCRQQVRSCCQQKTTSSCCSDKGCDSVEEASTECPRIMALCGCGSKSPGGSLLNSEPRILVAPVLLTGPAPVRNCTAQRSPLFDGHITVPDTPPPELTLI